MDPHATGICEDVLLDIGIIGYSLASHNWQSSPDKLG